MTGRPQRQHTVRGWSRLASGSNAAGPRVIHAL
jgi:hypothetical protein